MSTDYIKYHTVWKVGKRNEYVGEERQYQLNNNNNNNKQTKKQIDKKISISLH